MELKGILQYAGRFTSPEPEILHQLQRETHLTQVYPRMMAGHLQGSFLRMIVKMMKPAKVLEVGTFTGYSAICLAEGGGEIHTIEQNPELEEIIQRYLQLAGISDRVRLHIGNAIEVIPSINEIWDLVYLDADKQNYLTYYRMLFPRIRVGGWIIADNVLWDGKVIHPGINPDRDTRGIMEFNNFVVNDGRVESMLLPLRDGLMIIHKLKHGD